MTLRWPRVISVAASEFELGVPERNEPDDGDDIQPWCTPEGTVRSMMANQEVFV